MLAWCTDALRAWQCGNMALLSRIGNGVLPYKAAALGNGLQWANGHPQFRSWEFNFWSWLSWLRGEPEEVKPKSRRAAKGSGASTDTGTVGDFSNSIRGCDAVKRSSRELFSTLLLMVALLFACYIFRKGINILICFLRKRHHKDPGDDTLPFPVLEIQVVMIFFIGLAEGAGEAISSGCIYYEILGSVVLLLLLLFSAIMIAVVGGSLWHGTVLWQGIPWHEVLKQVCKKFVKHADPIMNT